MRMRRTLATLLAVGLLVGAVGCGTDRAGGADRAGADAPVPQALSFTGKTIDGAQFDGGSLAGRPVLLWFWAPWCGVCAGQATSVAEAARQYPGRLGVLGVAGLDEPAAMREFVTENGVAAVQHVNDQGGTLWRRFGITEQSVYVLLDARGAVVHQGYLNSEQFPERIKALVGP